MLSFIRLRTFCVFAVAASLVGFCVIAQGAPQSATPAASPTVDQIIDRYIAAIGGRAAMEKLTSRASIGTIDVPAMHLSGTVLIHEKAPNKILQVVVINGAAFRQAFDGTVGWTDDPADGPRVLAGIELAEARRDADFYHPLHLRQIYSQLTLAGTENVNDREAYLLEGTAEGETDPDKMYFDEKTGLILRVVNHRHTSDGDQVLQEDFQDYRAVDGIQLPFTILQTGGSSDFTIKIGEIHQGVALEDGEFARPQEGQTKVE